MNDILINQLARSSTSVGANYIEANNSISLKEFRHKIFLCKKEINEAKYWFELLLDSESMNDKLKSLYNELEELRLIFNKIANKVRDTN